MNSGEEKNKDAEEQPLKQINTNVEEKCKKSFLEKLKQVKNNITVEPIFAGLVIGSTLSRLAVQNLNLDKACRVKLDYGSVICDALLERKQNYTENEAHIQEVISSIESWKSIVKTAIPTILVIFIGAWSDRTGNRKLSILMPVLGEFLVCLCNIISTYFFKEINLEITMFFEAFFSAITGGWVMVYLGVFSYISDITSPKTRTFRVGMANLCMTAGVPIGTALSGILLKWLGYYGVFSISSIIYLMTFIYGLIYLKKITKPDHDENIKIEPVTCGDMVRFIKETAEVAFKPRKGNYRLKIILTLSVVAIIYGPHHGEALLTYFFVRYRLQWDGIRFSVYSTYSVIIHSIGALFSISVFSKRLGWHDSLLCLISVISKLIGSVYLVFVSTTVGMFLLPLVEILNATTFTSLRSMASKLVPSDEMGKMNSLFSLVETLAALIFDPTYSLIYAQTVKSFTGTVYVFSAVMTLPAITTLLWFFIQHRREIKDRLDVIDKLEEKEREIAAAEDTNTEL